MKFLNKLFKKGESLDDDFDPVIEEAFPTDDDDASYAGAFGQSYSAGYEDQLGDGPAEPRPYELEVDAGGPPGKEEPDPPWQAPDTAWDEEPDDAAPLAPPVSLEHGPISEWLNLRLRLQADPRSEDHHSAVRRAISLREERIDFYQELADMNDNEPYHRLSLARAYRAAGQGKEAIPHYQRYLRIVMDAQVFEELADVYNSTGEIYLASSARQIAQSIFKGGLCSNS